MFVVADVVFLLNWDFATQLWLGTVQPVQENLCATSVLNCSGSDYSFWHFIEVAIELVTIVNAYALG